MNDYDAILLFVSSLILSFLKLAAMIKPRKTTKEDNNMSNKKISDNDQLDIPFGFQILNFENEVLAENVPIDELVCHINQPGNIKVISNESVVLSSTRLSDGSVEVDITDFGRAVFRNSMQEELLDEYIDDVLSASTDDDDDDELQVLP